MEEVLFLKNNITSNCIINTRNENRSRNRGLCSTVSYSREPQRRERDAIARKQEMQFQSQTLASHPQLEEIEGHMSSLLHKSHIILSFAYRETLISTRILVSVAFCHMFRNPNSIGSVYGLICLMMD